jgi:gliding motility-associated-like protein
VNPASTTTYTVTYDLNGCSNSSSGTVTVNAAPTVTVNSSAICSGQTATLTATPSLPGGTYLWSPGGATTASITVNPASTTTYSVTYSLNGCTNTASGIVTVNGLPTVTVNSVAICNGQSATLTATPSAPGGVYSWQPGGETTQSITVSPNTTTNYTVSYTLSGCSTTGTGVGTGSVTVNPVPTVSLNSPSICAGQNATLTATPSLPGGTYLWSPGGATTASITVNPASSTNYTVVYSLNGCSNTSAGNVTVNAAPTVSVNSAAICSGQNATLSATSSLPGGTYSWSPGGATTQSITVSPALTTTYTVTYNLNGCSYNASGVVTVNTVPVVAVTVNSANICKGQPATLTASPTFAGGTYLWSPGGETTQTITVSPAVSTTYSVTYTFPVCNATASNTATATVLVSDIVASATSSGISCGQTTGSVTITASAGIGQFLYSIDGGANYQPSNIFTGLIAGSYTIKVKDGASCSVDVPVTLSVQSAPGLVIHDPSPLCAPAAADLTLPAVTNGSAAGLTYTYWSDAAATVPLSNPNAVSTTGTYYIKAEAAPGCSTIKPVQVTVEPKINGIRYPTLAASPNTPLQLSARNPGAGYNYQWSPPTGLNNTTIKDPVFNNNTGIEYLVTLTSPAGCAVVDTLLVNMVVVSPLASDLFVPKAWTPNGDGHNDKLFPFCVNVAELKYFRIFNRWGQLLFETNIISNGWDGRFNGRPQPMEVYTWTAEAVGTDGKRIQRSGNAVLIR